MEEELNKKKRGRNFYILFWTEKRRIKRQQFLKIRTRHSIEKAYLNLKEMFIVSITVKSKEWQINSKKKLQKCHKYFQEDKKSFFKGIVREKSGTNFILFLTTII